MAPDELDREVDALYAAPVAEFTRRRNAVAARLRAAGRRADATAVRGRKRLAVPVWAVNVLAREQATTVRALAEAVDSLRQAQLRGTGISEAAQAERRALADAVRAADEILRKAGLRATAALRERISRTLVGAAADRETRPALLAGRLTDERAAPGFDALAGARVAPPSREPAAKAPSPAPEPSRGASRPRPDDRRRAGDERRRRVGAAADALAERARVLGEEARRAADAAAEAKAAVAELARKVHDADARARAQAKVARDAARRAARAERAAAQAKRKLDGRR